MRSNLMPKTLYEKILDAHTVDILDGDILLYIDRHLIHEVTSPQAFSGLQIKSREVFDKTRTLATMDHSISTRSLALDAAGEESHIQLKTLEKNCSEHDIQLYGLGNERQGIVHVMAPEQGKILPGMTVVCGDSHTATHGAFGALAFGIGTSEVEHVLATQCLRTSRSKNMLIEVTGTPPPGIYAKDIILAIIGTIGTAGATGHVIEYSGEVISRMTMEERMTVCNMSIEAGAKAGLIAPDKTTFDYLQGRDYTPKNALWEQAVADWISLRSDEGAVFDKVHKVDVSQLAPQVTWGTNPGQVIGVDEVIPCADNQDCENLKNAIHKASTYVKLSSGTRMTDVDIDTVFIGSCTNSRIEDLRIAAKVASKGQVASNVKAIVVPGSVAVRRQAEREGLDQIFQNAGFEWRLPGCSMCLGMNDDGLQPGQRCASTSNRNFEGRQGRDSITHLVSPAMAAAAALYGRFVDVRELQVTQGINQ